MLYVVRPDDRRPCGGHLGRPSGMAIWGGAKGGGMVSAGLIDPDRAAAVLDARDLTSFSEHLLKAAHSAAGIEELFAYRIADGAPETLASSSDLGDVAERAEAYARRFHRSDPAVQARLATPPGHGFVCRIPADAIELGPYRKLCFERPRFSEKICFGWQAPGHCLVVTFYQRGRAAPDMAQLGALEGDLRPVRLPVQPVRRRAVRLLREDAVGQRGAAPAVEAGRRAGRGRAGRGQIGRAHV